MSLTSQNQPVRKFLIATHGNFSSGVKSSLDMIIGAMENVFIITAYIDENRSLENEIQTILNELSDTDELIVFCDLLGGSVTNQVLVHASKPNVHVIAGFNLPLLIEVLMADTDTPIAEVIGESITNAREQIVYVNNLLTANNASE